MSQLENNDELPIKNNVFELPITFVEHNKLSKSLIDDLELTRFKDNENSNFYESIFEPQTTYGKTITREWASCYTKNEDFLKQSQYLYKNYVCTN